MISADITILDTVSDFPASEDFFRRYDCIAGKCVLCNNLFDSLDDFCKQYKLNLEEFISSLSLYIEKNSR